MLTHLLNQMASSNNSSRIYPRLQPNESSNIINFPKIKLAQPAAINDGSWECNNLIKRLLDSGIEKNELAAQIEVSIRTINNLLNGKITKLKPYSFKKLLGYYCMVFS